MSASFDKLRSKLAELFQLDAAAELDFGIYRILNARRVEIAEFLDSLEGQVDAILAEALGSGSGATKAELDKTIADLRALSVDEVAIDANKKVIGLREKLAATGSDPTALSQEIFSHLATFFSRYYQEGDFISLRRYKKDTYAIPYEGEEVKLHWANADQYYIKSSETLRDYAFRLGPAPKGEKPDIRPTVKFKLIEADLEKDNAKSSDGQERRFVFQEAIESGNPNELVLGFAYVLLGKIEKKTDLNMDAVDKILTTHAKGAFTALAANDPTYTVKNKTRCILAKHVIAYTGTRKFDYFVHKDLGGFLRRELDFYIKNEILHLDDLDDAPEANWNETRANIKALRSIASKVIRFLAQLEDFQKKLWLKKKFVTKCDYVVTLDRIPEELYPEIAFCDAQRVEWVNQFAINEITGDLSRPGYSVPLTTDFIKTQQRLPIDTRHFNSDFVRRLTATMANEQLSTTRLLIKGENLQALRLLGRAYSSRIRAVYIDPPYNTGSDDFLYKDSFQHSSWVACLYDRLVAARDLLAEDGAIIASIGQEEIATLRQLMDLVFGLENRITIITVKRASVTGHKVINPGVVNVSEFVLIYAKNRDAWTGNPVFAERERDDRYGSFVQNRDDHCSKWRFTSVLDAFAVSHNIEKSKLRKHLGDEYEDGVTQYVYKNAMSVCQLVTVDLAGVGKDFRDAVGKSKESGDVVQVFERKGFPDVYLKNGKKVIFYTEKLTRIGDRVATAERASDIWVDVLPNDLHNEGGVELPKGKKPEALLSRLIELTTDEGDIVLDFFAGTATSAAVAEKLNRQWIAVECSDYFDEKPLRRIKNTLNGDARGISSAVNWKGGGSFKTIELESYEDALNNLRLHRSRAQELALEAMSPEAREQYQLGYMLDLEATGSQSLLNVSAFTDPWNYTLEIASSTVGETRSVKLDLVTTFNWLLGLTVLAQGGGPDKKSGGVIWVEATNPEGEKVLVLWRNTSEVDADALNVWCKKQKVKVQDGEFALIYVNGDHHLENLRREDQTWKVRLTDEEFPKLMWEGCE